MYQSILDHPDRDRYDLSTLRLAVTGAADIPVELIRRMHEELPFQLIVTGLRLDRGGDGHRPPHPTTTSRRSPPRWAEPVPASRSASPTTTAPPWQVGEPGEVLVRGYSVMRGYLDDPTETARTIDADGWLHTGDLGTLDERGCLRIVGRKKDMFIVGGFNAYPAEIENLLLAHPAVGQVAVVGMPDARLGEVGMAFVVRRARGRARAGRADGVGADRDGQLQGAAGRRDRHRAAGERSREGREGRAPQPGCEREGVGVDTRYSDEQLALRSATAALLADLGPRTVADLDDTARRARLAKAADSAGWFDLRGPGEDDGPLATGVEVAIVARELGRAAADVPFLGPVVAADLARQAGLDLDARAVSIVLDGALLDVAVRAPSGEAEGVAVDCAGSDARAPRRRGRTRRHGRRWSTSRSHRPRPPPT